MYKYNKYLTAYSDALWLSTLNFSGNPFMMKQNEDAYF